MNASSLPMVWTVPTLTLSLLADVYAVCRLPAGTPVGSPKPGAFSLLVQAVEETTLVCPLHQAPPEAEIDPAWRCFRIMQSFDFAVPGILASVLGPLAKAGIGIFATSTFSTDYILVKEQDADRAMEALRAAGHQVDL
ncbi:ACT domain-containing protein [Microvirga terrestris]|nr:ACT domain-containing protein [Microvirga terrestris]